MRWAWWVVILDKREFVLSYYLAGLVCLVIVISNRQDFPIVREDCQSMAIVMYTLNLNKMHNSITMGKSCPVVCLYRYNNDQTQGTIRVTQSMTPASL